MDMHNIIASNQSYGIIGLAKNTGKTTTLNHIIKLYKSQTIAMTSIGLDGEALDQIFHFPKPSIMVYQGHIIATAKKCLDEVLDVYDILEDTNITTPLGNVLIIQMKSNSNIILAGPSTNKDLDTLIQKLQKHTKFILVDGAFNRMTFSAIKTLDNIILTTGASYHENMEMTLLETKKIIKHFEFLKTNIMIDTRHAIIIKTYDDCHMLNNKDLGLLKETLGHIKNQIQYIYTKGAVTPNLFNIIMNHPFKQFKWIIEDATKLLIPSKYDKYIEELKIDFEVIHHIKLIAITINPFSPKGYVYDIKRFQEELRSMTNLPIINIKKEGESNDMLELK
jgi:molybdopterin-guanine dinucleotide biosynthesis protein